jgi:Ca-activated chloride channel family protein
MIRFLSPWWLLLAFAVLGLATAYVLMQFRRRAVAVRFSNTALLAKLAPRSPGWRRHVPAAAFLLALLALVSAIAKPSVEVKEPLERATIVLALDVSLSMRATDVEPDRFTAMKEAASQFVKELPPSYNLGLVSFAKSASVVVSPTKEHDQVTQAIAGLELQESTAIGEAVFSSLQAIASVPADGASGPPPARIVLLSDGFNTFGRGPDQAADAALAAAVPVSTIAFGTQQGVVELSGRAIAVPVDRDTLRALAEHTKGKYYEAVTAQQLKEVYRDLGSSVGYKSRPREVTQWFAALALLLGFVSGGLSLLWSQRLP